MEQLESRRLLAVDALPTSLTPEGNESHLIEIHLDVTQNGESIVGSDRMFDIDVGEQFDLEFLYDDLRNSNNNIGAFRAAVDIMATSNSQFRPVVSEVQIISLRNFTFAVGGFVTLSAEGVDRSVEIPWLSSGGQSGLTDDTENALREGIATVLDMDPEIVQVDFFLSFADLIVEVHFRDGLTLQEVSDLTVDASSLTGTSVTADYQEIKAFNGGDPALGVNPDAFFTSIDFRSTSLANQEIYQPVAGNVAAYDPFSANLFRTLAGEAFAIGGSGALGIDQVAAGLGVPYDGTGIEVLSVRMEAVSAGDGIEFEAGPANHPVLGSGVILFDPFGGFGLTSDQILFDTEDDLAVAGDDRRAIVIANVASLPVDVELEVTGDTILSIESGELVVLQNSVEIFRRDVSELGDVVIRGSDADESFTFDFGGGDFSQISMLRIDGVAGLDALHVDGANAILDLTADSQIGVDNVQTIDLSDPDAGNVILSEQSVARMSPLDQTVRFLEDLSRERPTDQLRFSDRSQWRLTEPVLNPDFRLTATDQIGGAKVEANVRRPWRNFVSPSDINNDGLVQASDALRIINALFRDEFVHSGTFDLLNPDQVGTWPGVYPDQNGDGQITALDALRVINQLASEASGSESEWLASLDQSFADWGQSVSDPLARETLVPINPRVMPFGPLGMPVGTVPTKPSNEGSRFQWQAADRVDSDPQTIALEPPEAVDRFSVWIRSQTLIESV